MMKFPLNKTYRISTLTGLPLRDITLADLKSFSFDFDDFEEKLLLEI